MERGIVFRHGNKKLLGGFLFLVGGDFLGRILFQIREEGAADEGVVGFPVFHEEIVCAGNLIDMRGEVLREAIQRVDRLGSSEKRGECGVGFETTFVALIVGQ